MSAASEYRITPYEPARHLEGCTQALRSTFSHNRWPAMDSAHEDAYVYRLDVPAACERIARERAMRGE